MSAAARSVLDFNPEMLVLARESRGQTQKDLAGLAGINQAEISKIERGMRGVSTDTLQQLAAALEYPESFFIQTDRVFGSLSSMYHRKRQSLSVKMLAMAHARANLARIHATRLVGEIGAGV